MELEFTLEKSDLLAYARFVQQARSRSLKDDQVGYIIGFTLALSILVVLGIVLAIEGSYAPLLMAGGILLCLILFIKLYKKWFFNTYYTARFFPDMFFPQKMVFSEESLTNVRQTSKAEFIWSAFIDIVHEDKHTFFLLPSFTGLVLPHHIFRNSTEFQGFKDKLNSMRSKGLANSKPMLNASSK